MGVYDGTISLMMKMCGLVVLGHINNLYNTTFWALQQKGGMSATEAEKELKVIMPTFLFFLSVKKRPFPFPFIFLDVIREFGVKKIYLSREL